MAIFIFEVGELFNRAKAKLPVVVFGLIGVSLTPAFGAGYVISAQDRARATALSQQAYVTFQAGDYGQALGLLSQSDQLRPDQPDGWNLRGMIFLKQKAYDQAQTAFARAVALDPGLWAAQFNLAEVFFQRKDFARARARFERLLSQTDRFKEGTKWELVQYKTLVACVLMGDVPAADKKLAKLSPRGASTPAYQYAQAALAFGRKNPAQAQKSVAAAQTTFPAAINDLFSDSLVQAGWQTPALPMTALASNVPASPSGNAPPLPSGGSNFVIDPQLQADSAGPLPVADAPTQPIVALVTPAVRNSPSAEAKPKPRPAAASVPAPVVAVGTPSVLRFETGTDLENGGLLLDE